MSDDSPRFATSELFCAQQQWYINIYILLYTTTKKLDLTKRIDIKLNGKE